MVNGPSGETSSIPDESSSVVHPVFATMIGSWMSILRARSARTSCTGHLCAASTASPIVYESPSARNDRLALSGIDVIATHQVVVRTHRAAVVRGDEGIQRLQDLRAEMPADVQRMGATISVPVAEAKVAADHHAALITGELLHILHELRKSAVAHEILFHVRHVQHGDLLAAAGDVLPHRDERLVPGRIADDRDDQV